MAMLKSMLIVGLLASSTVQAGGHMTVRGLLTEKYGINPKTCTDSSDVQWTNICDTDAAAGKTYSFEATVCGIDGIITGVVVNPPGVDDAVEFHRDADSAEPLESVIANCGEAKRDYAFCDTGMVMTDAIPKGCEGIITQEDLDKYLASLKNCAE